MHVALGDVEGVVTDDIMYLGKAEGIQVGMRLLPKATTK